MTRQCDQLWSRLWGGVRLFVGLLVPLALIPIAAGWVGDLSTAIITGEELSAPQWRILIGGVMLILLFAVWIALIGCKLLPTKILDRTRLMFQYVGTGPHSGRIIGFELANEYASL